MKNDLNIQFDEAVKKASEIKEVLPPDVLLRLYAYYKQAIKGNTFSLNANQKQDLKSAFKFNAWMQLRGMSEDEAKEAYINLVNSILK